LNGSAEESANVTDPECGRTGRWDMTTSGLVEKPQKSGCAARPIGADRIIDALCGQPTP
jgi:hypothetical protein